MTHGKGNRDRTSLGEAKEWKPLETGGIDHSFEVFDPGIQRSTLGGGQMSTNPKISRRFWLKRLALFSAAAGMPALSSSTSEAKVSKAAVHYRDYPKRMQMCHMCKFYASAGGTRSGMMGGGMMDGGMMGDGMMGGGMMGGGMMGAGGCQVVDGRISPMGWCDLYTSG